MIESHIRSPTSRSQAIEAMKGIFGEDTRRIGHALQVLEFAEAILAGEPGDREVVIAAAILHDIGIHQAEIRHGSSAGRYQELEGPPIALGILQRLGYGSLTIDHICRIIANHHSARDIDTPEFRIVWDADWLVNLPDSLPSASHSEWQATIAKVFKTDTGKRMAHTLYLSGNSDKYPRN